MGHSPCDSIYSDHDQELANLIVAILDMDGPMSGHQLTQTAEQDGFQAGEIREVFCRMLNRDEIKVNKDRLLTLPETT